MAPAREMIAAAPSNATGASQARDPRSQALRAGPASRTPVAANVGALTARKSCGKSMAAWTAYATMPANSAAAAARSLPERPRTARRSAAKARRTAPPPSRAPMTPISASSWSGPL